jgi:hypothetical protein
MFAGIETIHVTMPLPLKIKRPLTGYDEAGGDIDAKTFFNSLVGALASSGSSNL